MHRLLFAIVLSVILSSCGSDAHYDSMESVGDDGWQQSETISLNVNIDDASAPYDIYLNVRNTKDYEYMNMFIFLDVTNPSGQTFRDTVALSIADENGKWDSEDVSETYVMNSFLTYENHQFEEEGDYTFDLAHGMYDASLLGVSDVGIKLVKK